MGLIYALMGLIFGALFALMSIAGVAAPQQGNAGNAVVPFMMFGVGAIIILPMLYGFMGFIGGIIGAALYNVIAGAFGGLELEFETPLPDRTYEV